MRLVIVIKKSRDYSMFYQKAACTFSIILHNNGIVAAVPALPCFVSFLPNNQEFLENLWLQYTPMHHCSGNGRGVQTAFPTAPNETAGRAGRYRTAAAFARETARLLGHESAPAAPTGTFADAAATWRRLVG